MAGSHKRDTNARRRPKAVTVAGSVALLATGVTVTAGMGLTGGSGGAVVALDVSPSSTSAATSSDPASGTSTTRSHRVTRDESRRSVSAAKSLVDAGQATAGRESYTAMWATDALNLWTAPGDDATQDGELDAGKRVLATGNSAQGRQEVVVDGVTRWVTTGYLTKEKPTGVTAGLSMTPCPDGSVENGLTSGAVRVYRAVCNAFPQITSYGGWDAHGEHASGKAIDIMTSDVQLGTQIAEFLQSHASELDLYDIIWRQHIWTPVRASEGWRSMPDRGSATANHYDHVHVSVN
ncbi:MAG: mucin-2 protein [Nocardioides sp.]|uniref:mucin-2 protein n=1 Tax=Nocardioides sp. TaxID=35761 RepID=UPI0039E534E5